MFRIAEHLQSSDSDPVSKVEIEELVESLLTDTLKDKLQAEHDVSFTYLIENAGLFYLTISKADGTFCLATKFIPSKIPSISALNLPLILEKVLTSNSGLILVTGPAGSGRSTTIAACIDWINRSRTEHIISVESPIEYAHKSRKSIVSHLEQIEGESNISLFRRARKLSPDVIQFGTLESQDDVVELLSIAESGVLVVASMNTLSSARTIDRIVDMFPESEHPSIRTRLSSSLVAVLSQILVGRRSCVADSLLEPCFQKQVAASELMINTPAIANLIREGKSAQIYSAIQMSVNQGMQTLEASLASLVKTGQIDHEEALLKTTRPDDLNRFVAPKGPQGPEDNPPGAAALRRPSA